MHVLPKYCIVLYCTYNTVVPPFSLTPYPLLPNPLHLPFHHIPMLYGELGRDKIPRIHDVP